MSENFDKSSQTRPWPKKEDRLFPSTERPTEHITSYLTQIQGASNEYLIREGFYYGGMVLSKKLLEVDTKIDDSVGIIFPMVYCYRHFLELSLKSLIQALSKLSSLPIQVKLENTHDLLTLWNEFKKHADRAYPPHAENEPTASSVERCIKEFNKIDNRSETFRYSHDRLGMSFDGRRPKVDVELMQTTMANIHAYFRGCGHYADHLLELQSEML